MSRSRLWSEPDQGEPTRRRNRGVQRRKIRRRTRNRRKLSAKAKWGLVLLMGGYLAINCWLPQYRNIQDLKSRVTSLEERKMEMQIRNQQLQEKVTYLGTEVAVERLAREELGLIKPGEKVLIEIQP